MTMMDDHCANNDNRLLGAFCLQPHRRVAGQEGPNPRPKRQPVQPRCNRPRPTATVTVTVTVTFQLNRVEESTGTESSRNEVDIMAPAPITPASEMGVYPNGAVSADCKMCAEVGSDILKRGGSAVDAAIGTLLCVGVVNAHSMGLGGGFLMTVYNRESCSAQVIDAREMAPANSSEDMFQGNLNLTLRGGLACTTPLKDIFGGLSVAVPGELRGYWEAHQRFGKLPWADLFEPAIRICKEGHAIGFHMANALRVTRDHILNDPAMREVYIDATTGEVFKEDDIVRRPMLAQTLELIASAGADELYVGDLAHRLVQDIRACGGIVTLEDMERYRPAVKDPVVIKFSNGLSMYNVPPPGCGVLMGMILNILDGYEMNEQSLQTDEGSVLLYHRFTEACKFAYARRTEMGDESFVDLKELLRNVTSKEFAQSVRERIADNMTFDPSYYGAVLYQPDDYGTSHVAVIAPNGDAVSVTSSVNQYFGAKIMSRSTGIILNNVMGDFSAPNITNYFGLPPSPANFIQPGKRPLSSMCPAVFVDKRGDVVLVIGAAGGTRITSGTSLVSLRNLWLKEDIKTAIDEKRIHHQLFPQQLLFEKGFNEEMLVALEKLGHATKQYETGGPIVVAISRSSDETGGVLQAYADARKGGGSAGF